MASRYIDNLRRTVLHNASAYAYSILITTVFASLSAMEGDPTLPDVFSAIAGAGTAFVCVEMTATRMFKDLSQTDSPEAMLLGSATHLFAIGAGTGVAVLMGLWLDGAPAWALGAYVATVVYLLVEAVELTAAARKEERK